jgi:hypothetical protein
LQLTLLNRRLNLFLPHDLTPHHRRVSIHRRLTAHHSSMDKVLRRRRRTMHRPHTQ